MPIIFHRGHLLFPPVIVYYESSESPTNTGIAKMKSNAQLTRIVRILVTTRARFAVANRGNR